MKGIKKDIFYFPFKYDSVSGDIFFSHTDAVSWMCCVENFAKFTGKHLCQGLIFDEVEGPKPAILLKERLWYKCFSINFAKFLRTPFFRTPVVATSARKYSFDVKFQSNFNANILSYS